MALTKVIGDGLGTLTGNADLNGDLDVDGTTNLDVVDIDGNVTHGSNSSDLRLTLNSTNQYPLKIQYQGNLAG